MQQNCTQTTPWVKLGRVSLTVVLTFLSWGGCTFDAKQVNAEPNNDAITRSKHRIVEATGRVERKPEGASNFHPAYINTELHPGDLLKPQSGTTVRVLCDDGNVRPVPAGVTTGVNGICPPPRTRNGSTVKPRPGNYLDIPYIISPRATSILTEKPTLRWNNATNANRFTVTVRGRGLNWTEEFSREQVCQNSICEVVYPSTEPLQLGVGYTLVIVADTGRYSNEETNRGMGFELIAPGEIKEIQEIGQRIEEQDLPGDTKALVLAELYADYNLIAKAIEIIENLESSEKTASVYRLLGDLYWQIGLVIEAEVPYLEAIELAKKTNNLPELAAATAGLGKVSYARGNREYGRKLLEEAKAMYEHLEDGQRVSEVEEQLILYK